MGYIAPERADELNALIGNLKLAHLNFEQGPANFTARIKSDEILVTFPALLSLWAVARAAVLIGHEAMKAVRAGNEELVAAPGTPVAEALELLAAAKILIRDPNAEWPASLPRPVPGATEGLDGLTNNMFLAAAGWVNLHETAHFELQHELDTTDVLLRQQEHAADRWAVQWILEGCPPGHNHDFRIFAVAIAFTWISLVDSIRRGSVDHPHAWDRFERCISDIVEKAPELSPGLELSSHIFKAAFIPHQRIAISDTPIDAFFETLFQVSRLPR